MVCLAFVFRDHTYLHGGAWLGGVFDDDLGCLNGPQTRYITLHFSFWLFIVCVLLISVSYCLCGSAALIVHSVISTDYYVVYTYFHLFVLEYDHHKDLSMSNYIVGSVAKVHKRQFRLYGVNAYQNYQKNETHPMVKVRK